MRRDIDDDVRVSRMQTPVGTAPKPITVMMEEQWRIEAAVEAMETA